MIIINIVMVSLLNFLFIYYMKGEFSRLTITKQNHDILTRDGIECLDSGVIRCSHTDCKCKQLWKLWQKYLLTRWVVLCGSSNDITGSLDNVTARKR